MRGLMFFFFNDTATTEIYTLSLHDALPISGGDPARLMSAGALTLAAISCGAVFMGANSYIGNAPNFMVYAIAKDAGDRKSTRLNSSHANISYAVFCLKKKKITLLNSFHTPL